MEEGDGEERYALAGADREEEEEAGDEEEEEEEEEDEEEDELDLEYDYEVDEGDEGDVYLRTGQRMGGEIFSLHCSLTVWLFLYLFPSSSSPPIYQHPSLT